MASPRRRPAVPDARDDLDRVMRFVNTLTGRATPAPKETLGSCDALVDWARGAGMIGPSTAAELRGIVSARPAEANRVLEDARDLRETLHAVFAAVAQGRQPVPHVLAALATHMGGAFAQARLVVHDGTLQWAPAPIATLQDIGRELARVAARLVGSSQLGRVRACAAEDCRWWFVDETKNHSRRWCEMKTCGNRAKLRRFRTRQ